VHLVSLETTSRLYAMKEVMKHAMLKQKKVLRVLTELEILATAHHPFIVTMYASFETTARFCFIMEYCAGGAFFKVLSRQPLKRLEEEAAKFYASEVLLALEYLHYLGFFYRDLKPENILMHGDGHIVLTDFDLSKQAHPVSPRMIHHHSTILEKVSKLLKPSTNCSRLSDFEIVDSEPVLLHETNSFVGTIEYLAPEVVNGANQTPAVDWWGFGILIFEMMTGTTPFRAEMISDTLTKIRTTEKIIWPRDVEVSSAGKKLVKKLLRRDVERRLGSINGASDIMADKWFANINFPVIRNETPPIIPPISDICVQNYDDYPNTPEKKVNKSLSTETERSTCIREMHGAHAVQLLASKSSRTVSSTVLNDVQNQADG
jgi:protein-serine/threonine kinase